MRASWWQRWGTASSGLLALTLLPLAAAILHAWRAGWVPIGDHGLIELRAADVFTSNHPWLGTWTSASLTANTNLNNPGPLLFDALAPFVKLLGGSAGAVLGVAVINGAAIAVTLWQGRVLAGRRGELRRQVERDEDGSCSHRHAAEGGRDRPPRRRDTNRRRGKCPPQQGADRPQPTHLVRCEAERAEGQHQHRRQRGHHPHDADDEQVGHRSVADDEQAMHQQRSDREHGEQRHGSEGQRWPRRDVDEPIGRAGCDRYRVLERRPQEPRWYCDDASNQAQSEPVADGVGRR